MRKIELEVRKKMGKAKTNVKLSFERGKMSNGWLIQTVVFLLSFKKERKLKPDSEKKNNRTNRGRENYTLLAGRKYRVVTRRVKKGRSTCSSAILAVEKNGEIRIEKWQGNFPPQFSLI